MTINAAPSMLAETLPVRTVQAVRELDVDALIQVLDEGGDPNTRVTTVERTSLASQSLIDVAWAQQRKSSPMVSAVILELLNRGANPNACTSNIWPSVCFSRHPTLFLPLLQAGASPNGRSSGNSNESSFHPFAALYEKNSERPLDPTWLDALIAHGMDVNGMADHAPILVQAAFGWDTATVQRLIEAGASPMIDGQHIVDWMAERVVPDHDDAWQHVTHVKTMQTWWVQHEQAVLRHTGQSIEPPMGSRESRPRL